MGRLGYSNKESCPRCFNKSPLSRGASSYPSSPRHGSPDYLSCRDCGYEAVSSDEGLGKWTERGISKPWTPTTPALKVPWGYITVYGAMFIALIIWCVYH